MTRHSAPPGLRRCTPLLLLAAAAACGEGEGPGGVAVDTLRGGETVVTTASGAIAGLSDMAVAGDGRLVLLDVQAKQVVVVDPGGGEPVVFGREGEGPGEFERPMALAVAGDTVRSTTRAPAGSRPSASPGSTSAVRAWRQAGSAVGRR